MSDPLITYNAKMLVDGYSIRGNLREGFQATVPYLVKWFDAFNFIDKIMGATNIVTVGSGRASVSYALPHLFPGDPLGRAKLYASEFDCVPCGSDGTSMQPNHGMQPGEFFTHAKVTITYKTPSYQQQGSDDPNNANQLDPNNPITLCEQSIKISGTMRTRKGCGYVFSDGAAVVGDMGVRDVEATLVCKFPRIPFLPWQTQLPFVGSVNSGLMLLCNRGTLLFKGGETQFTATTQGLEGQMYVCEFAYNNNGWNRLARYDTGAFDDVYQQGKKGDSTKQIYPYMDLTQLFMQVSLTG